jgi:hypothetical protein
MELKKELPLATPSGSPGAGRRLAAIAILGAAFGLTIFQLWQCVNLWTPVGFVDTWPLYDRLMRLHEGAISFDHYLFDPQGPHLHGIVYFLYLIDAKFASGRHIIPMVSSLASVLALTALFALLFFRSREKTPLSLRFILLLAGTAVLFSSLSEATFLPFQTVVATTRFGYFLVLAVLVWTQVYPNRKLETAALVCACVLMTFYAAGGILSVDIILIYIVFRRGWKAVLCSAVPLLVYLAMARRYIQPGAEIAGVAAIVRRPEWGAIKEVMLGTAAYYGTPFTSGWPETWRQTPLLWIGFGLCVATAPWAVYILFSTWRKAGAGRGRLDRVDVARFFLALLSLLVLASAGAAATLWVARARIFGEALGMPAHMAVLTSSRYAATACVAAVIVLFMAMELRRRAAGTVISMCIVALAVFCGVNTLRWPTRLFDAYRLENAATAILMGVPITDPEASAVWPAVGGDWFWPKELLKTASYVRAAGISYAYHMPELRQHVGFRTSRLDAFAIQPVPERQDVCRLEGTMASFERGGTLFPQRFSPIETSAGEVVGYAVRRGQRVGGHLLCSASNGHAPLYLGVTE